MTIVVIDGIDGSGKTTQAKMLVNQLGQLGYKAIYIRPIFVLINTMNKSLRLRTNIISPRKNRVMTGTKSNRSASTKKIKKYVIYTLSYPYALITYLYMKLLLGHKNIVVCDRYFFQFFYDCYGIRAKNIASIFPQPDITFFIDGDLDIFILRMEDTFDTTVSRSYYSDVLNFYRSISNKFKFIDIDASLDEEAMNSIIVNYLTNILNCRRIL